MILIWTIIVKLLFKKQKFIENQLIKQPIHMTVREFSLSHILLDFEATSLYASAMRDEKSGYLKFETVYAFTHHINDETMKLWEI